LPPVRNNLSEEFNFIVLNLETNDGKNREKIENENKTVIDDCKGKISQIEVVEMPVELKYENFNYQHCIRKIIPETIQDLPSSYELIGKIAHMNLREEFWPFKKIIGKLIIDVTISL
jgi:tRNA (guanine37-N1)-methyltransferase